jgi:hypothetical protein
MISVSTDLDFRQVTVSEKKSADLGLFDPPKTVTLLKEFMAY